MLVLYIEPIPKIFKKNKENRLYCRTDPVPSPSIPNQCPYPHSKSTRTQEAHHISEHNKPMQKLQFDSSIKRSLPKYQFLTTTAWASALAWRRSPALHPMLPRLNDLMSPHLYVGHIWQVPTSTPARSSGPYLHDG